MEVGRGGGYDLTLLRASGLVRGRLRGRDGDFWFSTFFFFRRFDRKEVRGKGHAPRAPEKVGFRFLLETCLGGGFFWWV